MAKRSQVWNFFEKKDGVAICNECNSKVKTSGNTSNVLHHLQTHHSCTYSKHFKSGNLNQTPVNTAFNQIISIKGGDLKESIDEKLVWWIVDDLRPFNLVSSDGFKQYCKALNKNYQPLGRKAVTEKMVKMFENKKQLVIQHMKVLNFFAITTDLWSDTFNSRSYIGITIHFIDRHKQFNICLAVQEFKEAHTSVNIIDTINLVLTEFEIDSEKIVATVTDSAANMVAAMRNFPGHHIGCTAHKINLCVNDAIEDDNELVNLIRSVRSIVTYFKQSNKATSILNQEQEKDGIKPLKLHQDVPTRWNSTYLMVSRMIELRHFFSAALRKNDREEMDLSYSEIEKLKEIEKCLQPFYQMTIEQHVTISKIIPLVTMIYNKMELVTVTSDIGKNLKSNLSKNFDRRFGEIEKDLLLAFATLLDPRFKKVDFRSPGDCALAVSKLNIKLRNVPLTQPTPIENSDSSLWSLHNRLVDRLSSHDSGLNSGLKHYFELKNIALTDDPLLFWEKYKDNWHPLHNLAIKYLTVPATSVPCERLFSKTGLIISEKRSKIKPEHVNNLCFLQSLPSQFR
ncbi:zinc finger BED domain-containing protein 1-like [Tetranychus urticae]|uniref:zinc finger BED domain-containing protein 1-like n=1 Tax=Tetranychus urticae TaxID=32264 RepID=UPI00077C0AFC|nr:zinc finger BED domain-containing protein 1-like [Tetranychus urticae]